LPLSTWDVSPADLRRTWHSGLFSTGYVAILPWQKWPTSDKVRIVVRFILPDGRLFEAEKDIRVRLMSPSDRQLPPPAVSEPLGPAIPGTPIPLPPPRKLEEVPPPKNQAWWIVPEKDSKTIQASWRVESKEEPSLADAVELQRPMPLNRELGEQEVP
jgi:hypothetical protein